MGHGWVTSYYHQWYDWTEFRLSPRTYVVGTLACMPATEFATNSVIYQRAWKTGSGNECLVLLASVQASKVIALDWVGSLEGHSFIMQFLLIHDYKYCVQRHCQSPGCLAKSHLLDPFCLVLLLLLVFTCHLQLMAWCSLTFHRAAIDLQLRVELIAQLWLYWQWLLKWLYYDRQLCHMLICSIALRSFIDFDLLLHTCYELLPKTRNYSAAAGIPDACAGH